MGPWQAAARWRSQSVAPVAEDGPGAFPCLQARKAVGYGRAAAHDSDDTDCSRRICKMCASEFLRYSTQFGPGIVPGQATEAMVFAAARAGASEGEGID